MTPQEAVSELYTKVFQPVFFQKLAADYQLAPRNEAEQLQFLQLADIAMQRDAVATKQAAESGNSLLAACLADYGATQPAPQVGPEQIKSAAVQLMQQHPELLEASLVYAKAVQEAG